MSERSDNLNRDEPPLDIPPWSSPYIFFDEHVGPGEHVKPGEHLGPREDVEPGDYVGAREHVEPDEHVETIVCDDAVPLPEVYLPSPATLPPTIERASPAALFRVPLAAAPSRPPGLAAKIDGWAAGRLGTAASRLRLGVILAVVAIGVFAWPLLRRAWSGLDGPAAPAAAAVYTAPTLILRAAVAGQIVSLEVTTGDQVQPETPLLTLRVGPGSSLPVKTPSDLVIRAKVRGIVRGLDQAAGSDIAAGTPIARLADCDRAFLAVQRDTGRSGVPLPASVEQPAATSIEKDGRIRAGQRVRVLIVGQAPFTGLVRNAGGPGEPPGSLVVDPDAATAAACPLGAAATVTADTL